MALVKEAHRFVLMDRECREGVVMLVQRLAYAVEDLNKARKRARTREVFDRIRAEDAELLDALTDRDC